MLPGACVGREAGARNLVFFRVKWLWPAMQAIIPPVFDGCGWGRFEVEFVPPLCSATSGCSCVRNSMHFLIHCMVTDCSVMAA